jgi:translin
LKRKQSISGKLTKVADKIRFHFDDKDTAREKVLRLSREIIRHSADTIRAVHRLEFNEATKLLNSADLLLDQINSTVKDHQDLLYSGFIHDAHKELAEAHITFSLVFSHDIPDPDELSVSYPAYLNGLGEAVGELRRFLLDSLRRDDLSRCEEVLLSMDDIYSLLVTMDFPDAITYGLRRTTDNVRGILEKTRGDLTMVLKQRELTNLLDTMSKHNH